MHLDDKMKELEQMHQSIRKNDSSGSPYKARKERYSLNPSLMKWSNDPEVKDDEFILDDNTPTLQQQQQIVPPLKMNLINPKQVVSHNHTQSARVDPLSKKQQVQEIWQQMKRSKEQLALLYTNKQLRMQMEREFDGVLIKVKKDFQL